MNRQQRPPFYEVSIPGFVCMEFTDVPQQAKNIFRDCHEKGVQLVKVDAMGQRFVLEERSLV